MSSSEIEEQRQRADRAENAMRKLTANRIRVATNALVLRDDQALLVEFDDETGLHYNFPGGGVEPGETLEEAVRREVREETSLNVRVERLLLVVESVASRNSNLVDGVRVPWNELRFFFLCQAPPQARARRPRVFDDNQTGIRWVPLDALSSVNVLRNVTAELLAAIDGSTSPLCIVANPHG